MNFRLNYIDNKIKLVIKMDKNINNIKFYVIHAIRNIHLNSYPSQ